MQDKVHMLQNWKSLMKLASPIFLSLIGVQFMEIIDSIMIGRLGVIPLAAAAFVNGVVGIFLIVGTGFTSAISIMISRLKSDARWEDKCSDFMSISFWVSLIFALILTMILEYLRHHLYFFGQSQTVLNASPDYFLLVELSLIPHVMFQIYKQFTDGMGKTIDGSIGILCSLGLNVFFNWIFIFGNLGAPKLGIVGAGIGTLLSRTFLLFGYIYYLKIKTEYKNIALFTLNSGNSVYYGRLLIGIGISISLQYLFEAGIFSAATIMAGWISDVALASHQIALKISSSCFMLPLAISFASSIQVGTAVGNTQKKLAKNISESTIYLTIVMMLGVATVLWFGRFMIPRAFINSKEVLTLTAPVIVIAAIFQIFDGTQAVATGILRGYLDTKAPVLITFIAYWLISFPCAYVLSFKFDQGLLGLWYGLMIGLSISSILLNIRVRRISHAQ